MFSIKQRPKWKTGLRLLGGDGKLYKAFKSTSIGIKTGTEQPEKDHKSSVIAAAIKNFDLLCKTTGVENNNIVATNKSDQGLHRNA